MSWIAAAWVWLAPLSAALAEPGGAHLEWQRPPGSTCPPQTLLEDDVEQALGRDVFTSAQAAELYVRGTVEDGSSGVVVRLEARSRDGTLLGTRELRAQAGDCASLRRGIGLVLTLLVERDGLSSTPAEAPLRVDAGVWGGLLANVLPRAAFGAGPALALSFGPYALRADAAYWLPVAIQTARGIRAQLQGASLAARICLQLAGSEQSLQLCGGAQLGALFVSQTYPEGPATQVRLLLQGLVELRAALRLAGTARLEVALGPEVSLHRTSLLSVRSDGSRALLSRTPPLGMILSLGFII